MLTVMGSWVTCHAAYFWPLLLFMLDTGCTIAILHWIFAGFIQPYDLVTLTGSNSCWTALAIWWLGVLRAIIPSTPEVVFPKEYNYLLLMAMLCFRTARILYCDSVTRACHNFHTTSFPIVDISNMIASAKSYGLSRKAACTAVLNCCRALLFSVSCSKLAAFHATQYLGGSSIPKCGICCF